MKKLLTITLVILSLLSVYQSGICRSWDDLDEGEHEIYGSEKEEKVPINMFIIEKEDWKDHYALNIFFLFKYKDYPKYTSTRVLPFWYNLSSKIDNRSRTVLPLFLTWLERDGTEETSFIGCPLYYSHTDVDRSDRSLLFLFWWGREKNNIYSENSYQLMIPLFFHYRREHRNILKAKNQKKSNVTYAEDMFISPLLNYIRDSRTGQEGDITWWFPLVPITWHSTDKYGGNRNIFFILDYSWETRKGEDELKRFWLFPLCLWKKGTDGYTHILFPLYMHLKDYTGEYYRHILPFYIGNESHYGNNISKTTLTPLFGRTRTGHKKTGEISSSAFWFPILPLFYTGFDKKEGTHTNIAWIFDWKKNSDGSLKRFWFIPFVFHETRENGYRYYPPFYFRPGGTSDERGMSFGLFHYSSWSPYHETTWSWPYYHTEKFKEVRLKDEETPQKKLTEYYTHFLPLYWSWQNSKSTGRIIFPLYFNYRDEHTDLHVNLTGYAKKTFTGPFNPDVALDAGKRNGTWYIDTDISWLYDMWSFSTRIPLKKTETEQADKETAEIKSEAIIKTRAIKKSKEISRENSTFYWGWKVLFGWMAFERADSKRHFRLLPLSWFTWDENTEDKFYMFLPFFLSYKSEELQEEYFMIAPFYGSQKEGKSYARGFLVNLYWDEYNAETDCHEKTILWPFVNWYSSPEKNGFRVFPFVWHREWNAEKDSGAKTISLLYYKSRNKTKGWNITKENRTISPLYYYSSETKISPEKSSDSSTLWAPILPLFYRHTCNDYKHWNLLGFIDSMEDQNKSRFFILPFFYTSESNGIRYYNILGFLDWESTQSGISESMILPFYSWRGGEDSHLTIFPLLTHFADDHGAKTRFIAGAYWHTTPVYERQNFLYLFDHRKYISKKSTEDSWSFLFTVMQYRVSPEIKEMKLLWGSLLKYKNYTQSEDYRISALFSLMAVERNRSEFHHRILPLYYYTQDEDEWSLFLPPVLSYFSEDKTGDFDLGLLGVLYYRNNNITTGHDKRMWLLGTIYNEVKKPERGYHERGSLWGLLWNYQKEEETGYRKFSILKGLYKWTLKNGESKHTVLWVF